MNLLLSCLLPGTAVLPHSYPDWDSLSLDRNRTWPRSILSFSVAFAAVAERWLVLESSTVAWACGFAAADLELLAGSFDLEDLVVFLVQNDFLVLLASKSEFKGYYFK